MPGWSNSNRRDRLPQDWPKRRMKRLKRDQHMCQWRMDDGSLCLAHATDVDHVRPGDDHSEENLRSLCGRHHRRKSSSEGGAAAAAARRRNAAKFRRVEEHPGLL